MMWIGSAWVQINGNGNGNGNAFIYRIFYSYIYSNAVYISLCPLVTSSYPPNP